LTRQTVSLPLYPALTDAEQRRVLEALQLAA
jgi:dTDP-4-amino-4,6-dideoxygalactose transaminase